MPQCELLNCKTAIYSLKQNPNRSKMVEQKRLQSIFFILTAGLLLGFLSYAQTKDIYYVTGSDMISVTCGIGEGWYRNPFDCNKFYACVSTNVKDYFVYDYDCPEGLHYDTNRTMCTYPWEVKPKCDIVEVPKTTLRPFHSRPRPRPTPPPPTPEALPEEQAVQGSPDSVTNDASQEPLK